MRKKNAKGGGKEDVRVKMANKEKKRLEWGEQVFQNYTQGGRAVEASAKEIRQR